ncbi:hypothetical protein C8F04DRAFT_1144368, partial [Mycena alexandri]
TALSSHLVPLLPSPSPSARSPAPYRQLTCEPHRALSPSSVIRNFDTTISRTTPLLVFALEGRTMYRMRGYAGVNTRCIPFTSPSSSPSPFSRSRMPTGPVEFYVANRVLMCASSKASGKTFLVPSYIHIHFRLSSLPRISAPQCCSLSFPWIHAWPCVYPHLLRFFLQTSLA